VLEYNVRLGDPEAQVVLARLAADPVDLLVAVAEGRLGDGWTGQVPVAGDAAVCVVLAADGYPVAPRAGDPIRGLGPDGQLDRPVEGVQVFHAGTRREGEGGPYLTAGGRVLGVTAVGPGLAEARRSAYEAAGRIGWDGVHYRTDIAERAAAAAAAGSAGGVAR
jgi:phosphoribosylamine---glycine ligase